MNSSSPSLHGRCTAAAAANNNPATNLRLVEKSLDAYRKIGALETELNELRAKRDQLDVLLREKEERTSTPVISNVQSSSSPPRRPKRETEALAGLFSLAAGAGAVPAPSSPEGPKFDTAAAIAKAKQMPVPMPPIPRLAHQHQKPKRRNSHVWPSSAAMMGKIGGGAPPPVLTRDATMTDEERPPREAVAVVERRGSVLSNLADDLSKMRADSGNDLKRMGSKMGGSLRRTSSLPEKSWKVPRQKKVREHQQFLLKRKERLQERIVKKTSGDGSPNLLPLRKRSIELVTKNIADIAALPKQSKSSVPMNNTTMRSTAVRTEAHDTEQHLKMPRRSSKKARFEPHQFLSLPTEAEERRIDEEMRDAAKEANVMVKARTLVEQQHGIIPSPIVGYGNVTTWRDTKRHSRRVRGLRSRLSDAGKQQLQRRRSSIRQRGNNNAAGNVTAGEVRPEVLSEIRRERRKMACTIEMRLCQLMRGTNNQAPEDAISSNTTMKDSSCTAAADARTASTDDMMNACRIIAEPSRASSAEPIILRRPASLASALESRLYDSSTTLAEYSDLHTLDERLRIVAILAGRRIERARARLGGAMMP